MPVPMDSLLGDLPIVDAHQHFWNPRENYHPWLCDDPPIPFRYGDYSALRRPYLPADYHRDSARFNVAATVYVEAEWSAGAAVQELDYIAGLRRDCGLPSVAVAQAWLDQPDVAQQLDGLQAFPFVRSVRHKPRANPSPSDGAPGGLTDAAWRRGFAELARHGLRFDLQTPWWHLHEAAVLARDFPDVQILVNHTGLPADRSAAGIAAWHAALRLAAQCPNIALKISGLGVQGQPWTVQANRDIVRAAIDTFGAERCLFASNFPVDSLCASFDQVFEGFAAIVQDFSPAARSALFHDNAVRLYDIPFPPDPQANA
jgi:predicted TIM-barrel fold metal-dependent hydrolase